MSDLNQFSLENKVTLITGASRGIGRATALAFARAGSDIIITSRKVADLEKVASEIRGVGRRALVINAHLGRMEDVKKVADTARAAFGKVDILINNAGTSPVFASFLESDEKLWDTIMSLNLKGLFFLSQAVARFMKEQGGGCIINVASTDGFLPEKDNGVYAVSKAGVVMATKVMARELAPYNIRVNTLAPGFVHTKLLDSGFAARPGLEDQSLTRIPMGRIGDPEDMVGTLIYLASGASGYVTGHTFTVDGGMLYD
ncbi:MAG: glucose 1-dehydrogenase [Dehalococcoidia bacterium]|nr:MAG: glucose 1-dehydrogenase [Dehalococcoidia bacterium]